MTDFLALTDATWPPAARHAAGAFTVREGRDGGQRVSSATATEGWNDADIARAEDCHRQLGQRPLFLIRPGDEALDSALAARGYEVKDPVDVHEIAVADLAAETPALSTFTIWPPLEIQRDIWAEDQIGPARIAVMERAEGPRTSILGRINDRAAGTAFVALHGDCAMLHALVVVERERRQGLAAKMMQAAALWAQDQGATRLAILVTSANRPAGALYASLGMRIVGHYHYRVHRT
ncbi:GNAT family N-acetyltransferase [Albidovulum sediminicola]|uniref:GNAT family N-acetyltransferase n=1 Tax=Albidovulum sediminicola TaxID=2984331 RepID=A0ABT2YZ09_9RHOB|nr:GNAT family N-acetyltransferase [Defluviimonas sp. WL0075]MCV2864114.1 GNAT family N-acetyltransferase [Defluviimonas sp. WL0075]